MLPHVLQQGSRQEAVIPNYISYFSTLTYVVDTQKNRLDETVLFEHPKHMFRLMQQEIVGLLREEYSLIWSFDLYYWKSVPYAVIDTSDEFQFYRKFGLLNQL